MKKEARWYRILRNAKSCWHEPAKEKNVVVFVIIAAAWILGMIRSVLTFNLFHHSAAYLSIYKSCYMYASMRMEITGNRNLWGISTCIIQDILDNSTYTWKYFNNVMAWKFAKHVFPEMCSVFFASFLIFWWKSKSVFFSRGKRKMKK